MFNKSVSRIIAVQCAYCHSVGGQKMTIEECSKFFDTNCFGVKPNISFGDMVLEKFFLMKKEIDLKIQSRLKCWDIERVDKTTLSILRIGIAEFMLKPKTPKGIIIKEYLKVSDMFLNKENIKFVNAAMNAVFIEE